jgi:hypothetical protein
VGADVGKNTGESDEDGLGPMVVETVETAEGPMLLVGALLEESVGSHDGVRVAELLGAFEGESEGASEGE